MPDLNTSQDSSVKYKEVYIIGIAERVATISNEAKEQLVCNTSYTDSGCWPILPSCFTIQDG